MDLHEVTRKWGNKMVADVLGVTVRGLIDLRRGHTALTVDDLFQLEKQFPGFDVMSTIRRLGKRREDINRSRKKRKKQRDKRTAADRLQERKNF
jgi:plasmid maintenance system antidote protein VapI